MNDVDFPVQRVLEGIDAAAAAGLPVKVNAVVKRGANDGDLLGLAEHFRGSGHVLRFIEYMDVGSTNGWRLEDVVSAEEIVRRIGERWPLEPVASGPAGRDGPPLALPRRRRRDRRGRVRHPAVLRRLLARAPLGRGPPVHVPVRRARPRPPRAAAPRRLRRGARPSSSARSGRAAPTATRSCAPRKRLRCPRSRCPTSAASAFTSCRIPVTARFRVSAWSGSWLSDAVCCRAVGGTLASSLASGSASTSRTSLSGT